MAGLRPRLKLNLPHWPARATPWLFESRWTSYRVIYITMCSRKLPATSVRVLPSSPLMNIYEEIRGPNYDLDCNVKSSPS